MLWDIDLLSRSVLTTACEDDDGGVVAAAQKISVQHARNQAGIAREKPGVTCKIPLGTDTVAMQDQQGLRLPRLRKLRGFTVLVPNDAVVRNEMAPLGAVHHHSGDIADAGEANNPA